MAQVVWWLMIGLLAGSVARMLVPGRQSMGMFWTTCLGLVGSTVGGFISFAIFRDDPMAREFHMAGLAMSTLGALLVLGGYVAYSRRSVHTARISI